MARFISDQNKVVLRYESGTYGIGSGLAGAGTWIGEVTEHSIDDSENLLEDRFLGANTRSVSDFKGGPRNVTGKLTYHPQDMRLFFLSIGSVNDVAVSGNVYSHYVNQVNTGNWQNPFCSGTNYLNAPVSVTFEDSKFAPHSTGGSYFTRTVKGACMNSATLSITQGEKCQVELDYLAQTLAFSGGTSALTATVATNTPYLWNSATLTTSGIVLSTAKEASLQVNQNLQGPHYLNGSRDISVPILGNRENTLNITMDLDSQGGQTLYELYKANSVFNTTLDLNMDSAIGSQHTILLLSGCLVKKMDVPSVIEGPVESTVELVFPTIIGSTIDSIVRYNPW